MSRIGKLPINLPKGVTVTFENSQLKVKGPKGELCRTVKSNVLLDISDTSIQVNRHDDSIDSRAAHGLVRTLVNNMVIGVTTGFQTDLEINGVGYRAEIKGNELLLNLGFSHQVVYQLPAGISVDVEKMTKLSVKGIDKELVGHTAAKIRSFRSPEPYKGKGIKYADEKIIRKAGKTGKK
ncbi:MAG: 50S ribosomal protein L6 [Trichlorobacter sp.]|jgi:large subunit ribosomal protein L6|nr:50S ribosomal protein L6 [Trichlorobacter sp.]